MPLIHDDVWWEKLWKCFFSNRLLVKSGPCKKTTTSASILRVDLLTANLVTNSWLEAMKYTVQIKVLRHLAPMPLRTFIEMLHMRQCKNTSDNKCCYQTNQTWWPLQIENAVQKKVFSPQVTYLTHRHRLIAKKREKKKDYICEFYLGGLLNKANYHSVSNGIKLMSQRCYKELVPPTGVGSKARCDWFKKLYPHPICVCGKSHTVWQALKATKPLPKQLAPFNMKVIMNASHLAALKQSP